MNPLKRALVSKPRRNLTDRRRAQLGAILLVALLCLVADSGSRIAMAQQVEAAPINEREAADPEMKKRPGLAGHRFIVNPLTQKVFPRTAVQISMGVGQALDVEILPITVLSSGDTLQGLQGDLAVALLGFGYGYAIRDWLEVSAGFGLVGRLGTDVGSLFAEGATVLTHFDLGWLFRILERESVYLSGGLAVQTSGFTGLQVGEWVEGILDSTYAPLVNNVPSLRTTASLQVAWAMNDLWGLTAATSFGHGESVSKRTANSTSYQLALGIDADLYARTSVPIGFSLAGAVTNTAVDGRPDVDDIIVTNFRTAYTSKEDFIIGVDFNFSSLKPRRTTDSSGIPNSTKSVTTGAVTATMKYYF